MTHMGNQSLCVCVCGNRIECYWIAIQLEGRPKKIDQQFIDWLIKVDWHSLDKNVCYVIYKIINIISNVTNAFSL